MSQWNHCSLICILWCEWLRASFCLLIIVSFFMSNASSLSLTHCPSGYCPFMCWFVEAPLLYWILFLYWICEGHVLPALSCYAACLGERGCRRVWLLGTASVTTKWWILVYLRDQDGPRRYHESCTSRGAHFHLHTRMTKNAYTALILILARNPGPNNNPYSSCTKIYLKLRQEIAEGMSKYFFF